MRIAYIAPYQGRGLVKARRIVHNLSLAGRVKIERIAELLRQNSHEVEILSQGEVVETAFRFYSGGPEAEGFNPDIPIYYASAFPAKHLNALWSSIGMLRLFRKRHQTAPFDIVLIYNLKPPQVFCARYAIRRLHLPVLLEYEDDAFVNRAGQNDTSASSRFYLAEAKKLLHLVGGCIAVSPHLLSQVPLGVPKLLLRGVVGQEIVKASEGINGSKENRIVFSGTLGRTYGLQQLVTAWNSLNLPGWELHIAGDGEMMPVLQHMARGSRTVVLRGLLNRDENARLLASARIGINPHDSSQTAGNIFAFKIIEYLAAGNHLITTPMGSLGKELEAGVTYMNDNTPGTIAATLLQVINQREYERTVREATLKSYGPGAVSKALDDVLLKVKKTYEPR
jgi:glycosyltransferase involved in cell wall biosynthesis